MSAWRQLRGHWWFIRKFGPLTYVQYERVRKARDRELGKFDPAKHGEAMLRAVGATEAQIADAKRRRLA